MDRRQFLTATGLATGSALLPAAAQALVAEAAPKTAGDAKLDAVFERIFEEQVRAFPTFATSLGLDKGANADLKSKFDTSPYPVSRAED
jgi:hypothetical protein